MADCRVIGKAENPLDLGRAEHLPERLLNSLLHPADLAPQGREPAACGVEDRATIIEASFDRGGDAREFSHTLRKAPQTRKLSAGEREPPVEIADGAQSLDRLGQRFRLENPADLTAPDVMTNVMQTTERRFQAGGECFGHLGRQCLPAVNLAGVAARLHAQGRGSCRASRQRGPRRARGPCQNRAARACESPFRPRRPGCGTGPSRASPTSAPPAPRHGGQHASSRKRS